MVTTIHNKKSGYLKAIAELRLIDDDFMRVIFKDQHCLELLLQIIFQKHINLEEWYIQYDLKNLFGRSIELDIFVKTNDYHYINIEVQKNKGGALPQRARYHNSLIDSHLLYSQDKWQDIPIIIVVFITENDVLGYGLPIYHMQRHILENGYMFYDKSEIIYVNAQIQDETPLGKLMHDFLCTNPDDMYYDILKNRVRYFKQSKGGIKEMCEIMEQIKNEGKTEGIIEGTVQSIQKIMIKKGYSLEEALDILDIPEKERQQYIKRITA